MSLLTDWRDFAYSLDTNQKEGQLFWANYFNVEQGIYEKILAEPEVIVEGTVAGLAEKYGTTVSLMTGFLDGINESLVKENPIEEMEESTVVRLDIDKEKLYQNMIEAKADWLYELPVWETLLSQDRRKELYLEQKRSKTIVKDKKVGRNDPCPCGSGKKYKFCCGVAK